MTNPLFIKKIKERNDEKKDQEDPVQISPLLRSDSETIENSSSIMCHEQRLKNAIEIGDRAGGGQGYGNFGIDFDFLSD